MEDTESLIKIRIGTSEVKQEALDKLSVNLGFPLKKHENYLTINRNDILNAEKKSPFLVLSDFIPVKNNYNKISETALKYLSDYEEAHFQMPGQEIILTQYGFLAELRKKSLNYSFAERNNLHSLMCSSRDPT